MHSCFHKNDLKSTGVKSALVLLIAFMLCCSNSGYAASSPTAVTARIDTNQIRIGEQFTVHLIATASSASAITFPIVTDTLNGLEVVKRSAIDTLKSADGKSATLTQHITVTGFDSGYFVIEPFHFAITDPESGKADTLSTEAQLIAVKTIQVDTTKEIKDLKPLMEPPFDWRDYIAHLIIAILLIAAAAGIYFYIRKRRNRPAVINQPEPPSRPPHEIALEALSLLDKEKLWQQGYFKEYHIRLSDILRLYIEQRFELPALESTTDETLDRMRGNILKQEEKSRLANILHLADLVKFAKVVPIGSENEQSMDNAKLFIHATKPVDASNFSGKEASE